MNRVVLAGRLTADPEIRKSTNGNSVCRFSLAVSRKFKNANGQYEADFINCVAFKGTADTINSYVSKGDMLIVEGRIQTGSYTAQDGSKRYTFDVVVENITFINSRKSASERKESESTTTNTQSDPFESFGENVAIDDNFLE